MYLLMLLIIGLTGPRDLTSKPSAAHCLEFVAASPEGGWLQVRNVCREAVRGSLSADFGYCDFDVGCFDGFSAADIDAPEPWPGEAVYLIDGLWQRMPDDGPQPC